MSWGLGPWGFTPWGGGDSDELRLLAAEPVRENLVRLSFSLPVRLRGDFAPRDAAHLRKYVLTADTSTTGLDGLPARAVLPAKVELARVAGAAGAQIDVWTDRALSPYPSRYAIAVTEIYGIGGELLVPGAGYATFDGLQAALIAPTFDRPVIGADLANPQAPGQTDDDQVQVAGSFVADATGDYAIDQGVVSYRKRIVRRVFTKQGSFAHLPTYGLGIRERVKRLARPSDRTQLLADAEAQIKREPETANVTVGLVQLAASVWVLQVRATTRFGQTVEISERFVVGGS